MPRKNQLERQIRRWNATEQKRLHVCYTLSEQYLYKRAFKSEGPTRFVTYNGNVDAHAAVVDTYDILLSTGRILNKIDILLAFPAIKMRDVKNGIKLRKSIAAKKYTAIVSKKDRPHVPVSTKPGDTVNCILRNGLDVTGKTVALGRYYLVLRVGYKRNRKGKTTKRGKIIIVYRHGLLKFRVVKSKREAIDAWDEIA